LCQMYKKWIITAIIACGFGVFLWQLVPIIKNHVMPEGPRQLLGQSKNTAISSVIENVGGVKGIMQLGLTTGIYDITIKSDHLVNTPVLSDGQRGDRYLGLTLDRTATFNVGQGEAVKFEPAEFKPLMKRNNVYTISTPGNYVVNRQIPEGRYQIKIHDIKRQTIQRDKFRPATITVDSKFLNGNGSGDGQGGIISSTLNRSSPIILLENHRLLSITFSGVEHGSYVELMPLTD